MNKIKSITAKAVALILFFAMISAVILYQAGAYDISFIKRPTSRPEESMSDSLGTEEETNNFVDITQTLPEIDEDEIKELLSSIKGLNEYEGYEITYDIYSSATVLVRLDCGALTEDTTLTLRNRVEEKTVLYSLENGRLDTKLQRTSVPIARISQISFLKMQLNT